VFELLRTRIARVIAPAPATAVRMYHAAKPSRLTAGWGASTTSADGELSSSLTMLRARSRALVRDAAYAKRAKVIVVNNVIGAGIGLQGQVMSTRGKLRANVNTAIETAWEEWSRASSCHTGGAMHFADLERFAVGQVFEAGEIFVRKHYRPFGDSKVPFALELIEPERVSEVRGSVAQVNGTLRLGVETDLYYRPIAYWIRRRHPGETWMSLQAGDQVERVPADQILHLRIVDRWPQTRGEPWLHAVIRKLNDMDGYSEAELVAARGAASYLAAIETPDGGTPLVETQSDGSQEMVYEPGTVWKLATGEKVTFNSPNRPNAAMDPFMRMMLREVAAGTGVSYESLSRDYSQSNYSSSRLALLDDRDLWRVLQLWFIRNFRETVHREWLTQAVLAGAVVGVPVEAYAANQATYQAARFKPRGWTWIDPAKEVASKIEAVKAGFTTVSDVIAETANGEDLEDILNRRKRELEMMDELGLQFTTDPATEAAPEPASPAKPEPDDDEQDDASRRVVSLGGRR
jgi:lambda family phage portal protein